MSCQFPSVYSRVRLVRQELGTPGCCCYTVHNPTSVVDFTNRPDACGLREHGPCFYLIDERLPVFTNVVIGVGLRGANFNRRSCSCNSKTV